MYSSANTAQEHSRVLTIWPRITFEESKAAYEERFFQRHRLLTSSLVALTSGPACALPSRSQGIGILPRNFMYYHVLTYHSVLSC